MNSKVMLHNPEFSALLRPVICDYRKRSYEYWVGRIRAGAITFGGCTADGNQYHVEIFAFWDDQPDGNIRAGFAIDDGHVITQRFPYCEDFILSPEGRFIDE